VEAWPATTAELVERQRQLAAGVSGSEPQTPAPPLWTPGEGPLAVAGCFVCFPRGPSGPGAAGDRAWAAAVLGEDEYVVEGVAGAPYQPGLLALREGALLEAAVRGLPWRPDVLIVDATGRDHPRRAGLALHLGAVLDLPTVGVTHRPLLAAGEWPEDERGARRPLVLGGELVGYWLRTRPGRRPLAVHAAWRTDPDTAAEVVRRSTRRARTPEPLRRARRLARLARVAQERSPEAR
jgi:deoxyribonuclease V